MADYTDQSKTIAVISYLTVIGWVIALIMHQNNRSSLGRFHLRQMLGLSAVLLLDEIIIVRISTMLAMFVFFGLVVFWVLGIIAAINEEEKPVPFIGQYFQQWFAFID